MTQQLDMNGNVITNGYSTNLSPSQTISTASMGSTQPTIPIANPVSTVPSTAPVFSDLAGQEAQAKAAYDQANAQAKQDSADVAASKALLGMQGQDLINARDTSGATKLYNQLSDINAQAVGLQNEAQAIPIANRLQYQQGGIAGTESQVKNVNYDQLQQNALKALSLGQQAAIVSGQYDKAKNYADQIVNAKYDKIKADIDAKLSNLQSLEKYTLAPAEKKLAEATTARLNKEKADAEKKMADEKAVSDVGMTLRKYGVADSIVKDVLASKDINEAMIKAGNNLQDPKAKLEIANIRSEIALRDAQARKADREAIITKEPTPAEKKALAAAVTQAEGSRQAAQDKIEAVDSILSLDTGISSRVGSTLFSRGILGPTLASAGAGALASSIVPGVGTVVGGIVGGVLGASKGVASSVSGQGQQVSGAVHQLTQGLTLAELQKAKANGATFGALTAPELSLLAQSATKLNDWEIKDDKGNPTGYWNIDEANFRKELKTIQDLNKKALLKSQGTLIAPDESTQLDSMFQQEQPTANQYYQ